MQQYSKTIPVKSSLSISNTKWSKGLTPDVGTEMVPQTLVSFDQLAWLMAQEDFIEFGHS
jgi:hypothetical protein